MTGAASGIGKATALAFGKAGANVALLDLDARGGAEVASQIDPTGERADGVRSRHGSTSSGASGLRAVNDRFGRLDAVANVAAIYPIAKALDVTEDFWDRILSIDLRGVFFCCQEAIRLMVAQGSGAVVNVASGAAFRPVDGQAAYTAAKAGLVGMTRVMALEHARLGVRRQCRRARAHLDRRVGCPGDQGADRDHGGQSCSGPVHDSRRTGERHSLAVFRRGLRSERSDNKCQRRQPHASGLTELEPHANAQLLTSPERYGTVVSLVGTASDDVAGDTRDRKCRRDHRLRVDVRPGPGRTGPRTTFAGTRSTTGRSSTGSKPWPRRCASSPPRSAGPPGRSAPIATTPSITS